MTPNLAPLVHLLGFVTGAALYAMLVALLLRRRAHGHRGGDPLAFATGALGLVWNLGGLIAYGIRDLGMGDPHPLLIAISYAALGMLPAVVVHSLLADQSRVQSAGRRSVLLLAYLASGSAALAQLTSAITASTPAYDALRLMTLAYALLAIPLLWMTRRQAATPRAWWILALAMFAISTLHLANHDGARDSWLVELIGHHASIPLVLAILYHDYRFALADLFLKRALTLFALVGISSLLWIGVAEPLIAHTGGVGDPLTVGAILILWVATALAYPSILRGSTWLVDRILLRRVDFEVFLTDLSLETERAEEVEPLLDAVSRRLAPALAAQTVTWRNSADPAPPRGLRPVGLPTAEEPRYVFDVGPLYAGRRLMSDDLQMLERAAAIVARRIDSLRIIHERCEQETREQEISKLAAEAELRALRAQINPHFLFNALNTVRYLVDTAPDRAASTLLRLTALLRSVLRTGDSAVQLSEELELIQHYLEIERERFEERLIVEIDVPEEMQKVTVPPLLLQPLVENAIKHGIAPSRSGGRLLIRGEIAGDGALLLEVRNSGAAYSEIAHARGRNHGVGLSNLEQRLQRLFGSRAEFTIAAAGDGETVATLRIPGQIETARTEERAS
jgi:two-component system, LytTR family, sensor kinase